MHRDTVAYMKFREKCLQVLIVALGLVLVKVPGIWAAVVNVSVVNFAFVPAATNISVNDQVIWTWEVGANDHNVTSTSASQAWPASPTQNGPATFTNTFTTAGTFPYKCTIHNFTGSITVGQVSSAPSVSITSPSAGTMFTAPATVTVDASASATGESVTNVAIFTNDVLAAASNASSFALTLSGLQVGSYALTAVAVAGGVSVTSAPVDISVISNAVTTNIVVTTGTPPSRHFNKPGNYLIADQFNNRVVEITSKGEIVWSFGLGPNDFSPNSIVGVNDAERVGVLTLMAGTGTPSGVISQSPNGAMDNRVLLVDAFARPIWQYGQFGQSGSGPNLLNIPVQCTFLPTYHILITDQGNNRVIEVTLNKDIVWQYPGSNSNASDQINTPNSAELLANGNILIADESNNRAIEVTRGDVIVHTFTAGGTVSGCAFASRLSNGHTLLTDAGNARAVEVDANDNVVWEYVTTNSPMSIAAPQPTRALRLRNNDTIISDQFNNRVIIVNHAKHIVADFGLPLAGGTGTVGNNSGFSTNSVQQGLYAPYDAKAIGDYTGLTPPIDDNNDSYNEQP
jgi:plastocyanin